MNYFKRYLRISPFSHALWRACEARSLESVKLKRPILDLGCGFGEFAGVFYESSIEVGVDNSHLDIEKAGNIGKYKRKMLEEPFTNKLKLFSSKEFLLLALGELMHMTKDSMVRRMKSFIPTITPNQIIGKGISGIRSSVVNERGEFEPEAILLDNDLTFHVLAYNSPGASGAPGFAACMVGEMQRAGLLDELTVNKRKQLADIEEIIASFRNLGL